MIDSKNSRQNTLQAKSLSLAILYGFLAFMVLTLVFLGYFVIWHDIDIDYLTKPIAGCVIALGFFYGTSRVWSYHPIFDPQYLRWLARTPWTPNHPLPKGPLNLLPTDVLVVGSLSFLTSLLALTLNSHFWQYTLGPGVAFAAALALNWTLANILVGQISYAYMAVVVLLVFGFSGAPHIVFLFCPFVVALVAWLGVRSSLWRFPWTDHIPDLLADKSSFREDSIVGWPFQTLMVVPGELRVSFKRGAIEASLATCSVWFFVDSMRESEPREDLSSILLLVGLLALAGAGMRLFVYGPVICSHLCWGQRVAKRQWLIPRHDQIFALPLLLVVIGCVLPAAFHHFLGFSIATVSSLAAGIIILLGRSAGPSVQELYFTGVHSKFGTLSSQSKEFITIQGSNS